MKSVIIISLILAGCANNTVMWNPPPQGMDVKDLDYYKWDCSNVAEAHAFYTAQLATTTKFQFDEQRRAIIYYNLNQMNGVCPEQAPKPKGCLHVHEDSSLGTGQVTVCDDGRSLGPFERPVVNKWEPIVDH
jgi:hypothetical protein